MLSADHAMLKEIKITDIRVGRRHRSDMGDLTTLAMSIRQEGLLQPVGVTDRLELVFGERRLLAYRDILKRKTIPARIVDDFRPAPKVIHRIAQTHCGTSFLGLLTRVLTG